MPARARRRTASLEFLDRDIVAEAGLLSAHARWHHGVSAALTLGFCPCGSVEGIDAEAVRRRPGSLRELFADRPFDPPWAERRMARTGDLTARRDDLFRAATGNNFGIAKAFCDDVGDCDESFTRHGGEDPELAGRVQVRGGLLVPVRDALGRHQGRWAEGRARKERDQELQRAKLAHLIADPDFFLAGAKAVHPGWHPGWHPARAGMPGAARPPRAGRGPGFPPGRAALAECSGVGRERHGRRSADLVVRTVDDEGIAAVRKEAPHHEVHGNDAGGQFVAEPAADDPAAGEDVVDVADSQGPVGQHPNASASLWMKSQPLAAR